MPPRARPRSRDQESLADSTALSGLHRFFTIIRLRDVRVRGSTEWLPTAGSDQEVQMLRIAALEVTGFLAYNHNGAVEFA